MKFIWGRAGSKFLNRVRCKGWRDYAREVILTVMKKGTDLTGGSLTEAPNAKYQKFFAQFDEHTTTDVITWRPVDLLAYFCAKYQASYNASYAFKYNTPSPSKCFEIFQVKKLSQILSSKPNILKDYIDWIFDNKVGTKKKRFTSISFLTREENVKEYKWKVLPYFSKIDRTTSLPEKLKLFLIELNLNTYGDLAFIWLARESLDAEIKSKLELGIIASDINIRTLEKMK